MLKLPRPRVSIENRYCGSVFFCHLSRVEEIPSSDFSNFSGLHHFFVQSPVFEAKTWRERGNGKRNGPLSLGRHVESQENKKLCFCKASLALKSRLGETSRAKTKLCILLRLNMAAE